jgi:NADH-quinone oxidoreductase subunit N
MTLGTFGVILALHSPERPVEKVDDLAGLLWTRPWSAVALALCLFSLAGIPPLAGFMGKLRIFQAALEAARGADARTFQLLAVIGVINAAIGAYYYLRILMAMTFREPVGAPPSHRAGWPTVLAVGACALLSLVFGVIPAPIAEAARQSGEAAMALPSPLNAASAVAEVRIPQAVEAAPAEVTAREVAPVR